MSGVAFVVPARIRDANPLLHRVCAFLAFLLVYSHTTRLWSAVFVCLCFIGLWWTDLVLTSQRSAVHYRESNPHAEALIKLMSQDPTVKENNIALRRFDHVVRHTECLFARRANNWGSQDWDSRLSLEQNVSKNIAALALFMTMCRARATPDRIRFNPTRGAFERTTPPAGTRLQKAQREATRVWRWLTDRTGADALAALPTDPDARWLGESCDGFCFEIRGRQFCETVDIWGQTVRRVLTALSALDPAYNAESIAVRPMFKPVQAIRSERWHFEFMHEPLTVTSFAPCYDSASSRHSFSSLPPLPPSGFGTDSGDGGDAAGENVSAFVLLQPESSFVWHDMGPGITREQTNWSKPHSAREKIRCKFADAGRPYAIADTNEGAIPACEHIVRSAHDIADPPIPWYVERHYDVPPPVPVPDPESAAVPVATPGPTHDSKSDDKTADSTTVQSRTATVAASASSTGTGTGTGTPTAVAATVSVDAQHHKSD